MSEDKSLQIIREAFAHVLVDRIAVEYDAGLNARIAKVYVRDNQLEVALANNGAIPRRAAMESGMDVEVEVSAQ